MRLDDLFDEEFGRLFSNHGCGAPRAVEGAEHDQGRLIEFIDQGRPALLAAERAGVSGCEGNCENGRGQQASETETKQSHGWFSASRTGNGLPLLLRLAAQGINDNRRSIS